MCRNLGEKNLVEVLYRGCIPYLCLKQKQNIIHFALCLVGFSVVPLPWQQHWSLVQILPRLYLLPLLPSLLVLAQMIKLK